MVALLGALTMGASSSPEPLVRRDFVVAIDPGHGGTNRGCQAANGVTHEKDVTLEVARDLARHVHELLPHARVVLTRDQDETRTLAERVAFANRHQADLFISLHANASPTRTQHGFETYVLDVKASSREAARTALRENDDGFVTPGAVREVDAMVRELVLVGQRVQAAKLAKAIQEEQAAEFPRRFDRGVKQAPFDVLMGARMPAVLFEVGFLDHSVEGTQILEPVVRGRIVDGLGRAIVRYYRDLGRTL